MFLSPLYRPCYQDDERLLFTLRPNCSSVFYRHAINGGDRVLHHINSAGFRGAELQQFSTGVRVVVYGDSFIHAIYSPYEETFVVQLDAQLAKRLQTQVEVINAGVSAYGPDQASLRLADDLRTLRPDVIVVAVYAGNDHGDLLRNKLFRLDDDGMLEENDGRLARGVLDSFANNRTASILKYALQEIRSRFGEKPTPYSHLDLTDPDADPDVALMDYWLEMAELGYRDYVVDENDVVTNVFIDHYSADVSLRPDSESAIYKTRLMNAVLQRTTDIAHGAGVQLVLLFIPHPFNVADEYDVGRVQANRFPQYDRRNLIAPLEEWARVNDVPFVSLFDLFRKRDANALYFHGGDDHWNAAGQKLAAETVAEYLVDNQLLERPVRE